MTLKLSFASLAMAFVLLFGATMTSAATITNVEFSNGDVTVQGSAGQSVTGKVRIEVGVNEEVERVQFDVLGDNLAPVCIDSGRLQEGENFVQIPGEIKFPPNTGTYTLQVKSAGIFGGFAATNCLNNVNGTNSFNNAVRTVGGNSGSVGGGTIAELQAQIAELLKLIAELQNPTTPVKPAYCATRIVYNGVNASAAQAWLLANGFAGPFHAIGVYAPTGNWKSASMAASAQADVACK